MPLYKKALIIGATSGIGEALAARLVAEGTKVIVTGRRQDRLDQFVAKHGKDNAFGVSLDLTKMKEIPAWTKELESQHPDIDCVVLNAGIQRQFDFTRPETVDLDKFDEEITTNYTACVHATMAFLPFLQKQPKASLIYISATLGLVPGMLRTGGYNASKGALHNFLLVFREQLKRSGSNVKVIEVFPPAVQTELHDTRHQPDLKNGGEIGMPLPAYTEAMYKGLESGVDEVGIGPAEDILKGFEAHRQEFFHNQIDMVNELLKKYTK